MDVTTLTRLYGLGRVGFGVGLLVAPGALGRPWVGPAADGPGEVPLRALGVRDLILGGMCMHVAGQELVALRWLVACAVADAVDLGATLAARERLPATSMGVAVIAASGAAMGVALARAVRRG